ncbi:MAG: PIN domain-containing protein [Phycisphaerae bacterium]
MNVLVDTSVWSLALRRPSGFTHPAARELSELIGEGRAAIMGSIRQELLSGIADRTRFERIREYLRDFPDVDTITEDHERAAEFYNVCRAKGVQGTDVDFLICALAVRHSLAILTTDEDFKGYARHLPIVLHPVRPEVS